MPHETALIATIAVGCALACAGAIISIVRNPFMFGLVAPLNGRPS